MIDQDFTFLNATSDIVAPRLLGCFLERDIDGKKLVGKIVETEAYAQNDAASHSYRGETARTKVMFGASGVAYVYFTYGMHYCMNIVTGNKGQGAAVLIRAIEPLEGIQDMELNRIGKSNIQLTNGPAKFCQAFAIDKSLNEHNLRTAPLRLIIQPPLASATIVQTTRIGISKAKANPWRFYEKGNPYVSQAAL